MPAADGRSVCSVGLQGMFSSLEVVPGTSEVTLNLWLTWIERALQSKVAAVSLHTAASLQCTAVSLQCTTVSLHCTAAPLHPTAISSHNHVVDECSLTGRRRPRFPFEAHDASNESVGV